MVYITSPEFSPFRTACENDDTALFDQAISLIKVEELGSYYDQACRCAIINNSRSILSLLIRRGVSVESLYPLAVKGKGHTSKETLELLLANGWSINTRYNRVAVADARPFMWHVIESRDMVAWCLERGADPTICDRRNYCEPILETAAAEGDIDTFELLRSKGAPLGWRTLHRAVEAATYGPPDPIDAEKETEKDRKNRESHRKRMDMVRHLVYVAHLNVNAPDHPKGSKLPDCRGTPICYIPSSPITDRDTRELTWLLLDQGADPTPGLECVKWTDCSKFMEDVEAWKAKQDERRRCCVQ